MGTMLYEKGIFFNRCFEEVCLSDPALVAGIHKEYLEAGADVVTTNSWGAGIPKLRAQGFEDKFVQINQRAVQIARAAVKDSGREGSVHVAGSIGPLGVKLEPLGALGVPEAEELFRRQAEALSGEGADLIILETFVDMKELEAAIRGVRAACALPLIACMTINADGTSIYGTEPEVFTADIDALSPEVIGLNCSEGPKVMLEAAEKMLKATRRPLIIQPNAGMPVNVEGRNIYASTPKYMATYAQRMIQNGVKIVGGCCGTTPAHIKEMRNAIRALGPAERRAAVVVTVPEKMLAPVPLEKKSRWAAKLSHGEFVTCVELVPPKGIDVKKLVENASILKESGIDAVNLPDSPRAMVKMSAIAAAVVVQQATDMEAMPHYTCKDKNLLALQADLLGAHALGIRNILLVTGDPPTMGTYPDATAVFNIDSIGLCNLTHLLNRGFDLGNNPIGKQTEFCYGVALNPGAVNPARELERFKWKLDAGAEFAVTQPVYDPEPLKRFLDDVSGLRRIPVIAGIWPLVSLRSAEFMKNEVPGVVVPDSVIARMAKCDTKEAALEEGLLMAHELLDTMRPFISGVQLSAPLGNVRNALKILGK